MKSWSKKWIKELLFNGCFSHVTRTKFQKRKKMSCHQGNTITFCSTRWEINLATKSRDLFFNQILIDSKIMNQLNFQLNSTIPSHFPYFCTFFNSWCYLPHPNGCRWYFIKLLVLLCSFSFPIWKRRWYFSFQLMLQSNWYYHWLYFTSKKYSWYYFK